MQPIEGFNLFNRYLGEWYAEKEISLIQYNESKDMLKKLFESGIMPDKCELTQTGVEFQISVRVLGILLFCTIGDSGDVWSGADHDIGFESVAHTDWFSVKLKEGAE